MRITKLVFASIVALLMLIVSACSSATSKTDDELGKIKSAGVLNIGIEAAYPPFNYYNNKNQIIGFDVDIAKEVGKRMGVKINFVATPWDSIIGGLLANKYDAVISSMAITPEREKKVDFTDPYYHTGSQLFVPNNSTITDPTKISGRKIGVSIGTTFEKKARELGANLTTYKNDLLAFQDLQAGRTEGVITDTAVGANIIKAQNYPFKMLGQPLLQSAAGIAINKNQKSLQSAINKALNDMVKDGTYDKISKQWFGINIH